MGVATMANKKALFVTFMDRDKRFKVIADFDRLVTLMSCLDTQTSRSGDIRGDNRWTDRPLALPLRMRAE